MSPPSELKRYPSRFESRAGFFASTRDECLSPWVRLECNPEIVFAWPGMGRLMLNSITTRDYPVLSGIYLLLSISVAVMMIVVDVVYAYADPRIRYED